MAENPVMKTVVDRMALGSQQQLMADTFAAWARVWSPVADANEVQAAWEALAIPLPYETTSADLNGSFHVCLPGQGAALLLHVALGVDGGVQREICVRLMQHLGLVWCDQTLPPDHLAVMCDILAASLWMDEKVLINELPVRFFYPWCDYAMLMLEGREIQVLVEMFCRDINAL